MSARALAFATSAAALWLAPNQTAEALTPLTLDASAPAPAPISLAAAPPEAFEPLDEASLEPAAVLERRRQRLQCVPFAREESGVEIYGDANTWWSQAQGRYARERRPEEGAVMVMRGYANANRGHVAVVREIVSDRMVLIDHANWLNGGEVTRAVPVRDVSPSGDWSEVKVWHVPGQHWGGRVYRVQGFIEKAITAAARAAWPG